MPNSPAARADLYNELSKVIGPNHADTLMSYLPEDDPAGLATKADLNTGLDALRAEMGEFRTEMRSQMAGFRTEMRSELAEFRTELRSEMTGYRLEFHGDLLAINQRLDRLFLALVGGLFLVIATFITGMFFG